MNTHQIIVSATLFGALGLFVWGRWRYDLVALLALLVVSLAGIVPAGEVFAGFGHPAVITVAAVLILSHALGTAGAMDTLQRWMNRTQNRPVLQVFALTALVAVCSAFMNNVGALALMMPLAVSVAERAGRSPSEVLMPLSFASLLGGLITLIGTPPNVIIATYRQELTGTSFSMFAFTPVGLGVAAVGLVFISLIGWRLLPAGRKAGSSTDSLFQIEGYITETEIPDDHPLVGQSLRELERLGEGDVSVVALVRSGQRLLAPAPYERLLGGDTLVLEGPPSAIKTLVDGAELAISTGSTTTENLSSDRVGLFEAVISPGSALEGRSARMFRLHERYRVNLLALSRQGQSVRQRINRIDLRAGDVLLLQGEIETMGETLAALGCLPLARRNIRLGRARNPLPVVIIFAIAVLVTTFGLLPAHIAFVGAVAALLLGSQLPLREAYRAIDGPIIVLLGAMIPVGRALEATGVTAMLSGGLVSLGDGLPPWAVMTMLLVTSMALSDVINNAATAVIMAPIAATSATALGLPIDPFLMTVAVGSSCTFMTPIGHQSNTLVMGPGGYRFGDYWRMGLPLNLLVVSTSIPLILWAWPL